MLDLNHVSIPFLDELIDLFVLKDKVLNWIKHEGSNHFRGRIILWNLHLAYYLYNSEISMFIFVFYLFANRFFKKNI